MTDEAATAPDGPPPAALLELQAGLELAKMPILDVLAQITGGIEELRKLEARFSYHVVLVPDDGPPSYRVLATVDELLETLAESVKEYRFVYPFHGRRLGVSRNGRWLVDDGFRRQIPSSPHDDGDDVDPDGVLDLAHGRKELIPVADGAEGDSGPDDVDDAGLDADEIEDI